MVPMEEEEEEEQHTRVRDCRVEEEEEQQQEEEEEEINLGGPFEPWRLGVPIGSLRWRRHSITTIGRWLWRVG